MSKYRKKPVVISAWQWQGKNCTQLTVFLSSNALPDWHLGARGGVGGIIIPTLEGDMIAQTGDWIIGGVRGEFYPIKDEIFKETYESVGE